MGIHYDVMYQIIIQKINYVIFIINYKSWTISYIDFDIPS